MQKVSNKTSSWQGHEGEILAEDRGFDVIDCKLCGFKHITPIPTENELEKIYEHDYYTQEKPQYLDRYREDLEWWNQVYTERYKVFEKHLDGSRRRLLDIGSGPGYFLLNGKNRGWIVKGVEPSTQAAKYSQSLGVEVDKMFFTTSTVEKLDKYDVINMSAVLEHIPQPKALLSLISSVTIDAGLICIVVPNDFNPFQLALRDSLNFEPWWVGAPHHINYFDFDSLQALLEDSGFEVIHKSATFPIDMFLMMGDNYIGNDELGRICHTRRMNFEKAMCKSGMSSLMNEMYSKLADQGLGREVVLVARKIGSI